MFTESNPPRTNDYSQALEKLIPKLSEKQIELLKYLYSCPGHSYTSQDIRDYLGYPEIGSSNLAYGNLCKRFAQTLNFDVEDRPSKRPGWWRVISTGDSDGAHFCWTMRSEFSNALEAEGIVDTKENGLLKNKLPKSKNISEFYTEVLGANLTNTRWSWGAYDPLHDRIFLRVWKDEIIVKNGQKLILVLNDKSDPHKAGTKERKKHLDQIRNGTSSYGVLCVSRHPGTVGSRKIVSFRQDALLQLGAIVPTGSDLYLEVIDEIKTTKLSHRPPTTSTVPQDLDLIRKDRKIEETTKEALVQARLGQGRFRSLVPESWGNRCSVSGTTIHSVIKASHIKPWRDSNNEEKLDPANGLPLVATIDSLFDSGLITFEDDGYALLSTKIPEGEIDILKLTNLRLTKQPSSRTQTYLKYHRSEIFQK